MKNAARFSALILLGLMLGIAPTLVRAEEQVKQAVSFEAQASWGSESFDGGDLSMPQTPSAPDAPSAQALSSGDAGALGMPLPELELCAEDFEGTFPGNVNCDWELRWCGNTLTWDDDDCRASTGIKSAWCANGRSDDGSGGPDPCAVSYPNGMCAWMIAGPFDLSGATNASVIYDWWLRCEGGFYDRLFVGYSTNGTTFYGERFTGDFGDEWHNRVLSLANVLGQPQVWIGFLFSSDVAVQFNSLPNGAFIDNIRIVRDGQAPILPDLIVDDIEFNDTNCPTQARALVKNQGTAAAGTSICRLSLDGSTRCDKSVPSLPIGSQAWTSWCDLGSYSYATHQLQACADQIGQVGEGNEGNNCRTENFGCEAAPLPDLVVIDIEFNSTTCPSQTRAKVRNQGAGDAGSSVCCIRLDGALQCDKTVEALPAGQEVWTSWCGLGTYSLDTHSVQACADAGQTVDETNNDNNCRTEQFDCPPGEPTYYFDGGLEFLAGAQNVEIFVNLRNDQPVNTYGINLFYDPDVFACDHLSLDGTRVAGAGWPVLTCGDGQASAGVVLTVNCAQPLPAGEGPVLKLVLDVRAEAPMGTTVLDLMDHPPAVNRITFCDGSSAIPVLLDGSVEILGDGFVRGDTDADGQVTLQDPMYNLSYLYGGGPPPPCKDAADFDDSGVLDMRDPLASLEYQYGYGDPPVDPFPQCGADPTPEIPELGCGSFQPCNPLAAKAQQRSVPSSGAPANLTLAAQLSTGSDSLVVPMVLETEQDLAAFEIALEFARDGLTFGGLDTRDVDFGAADFYRARAEDQRGEIRLGCVFDFGLAVTVPAGKHDLGTLVFIVNDAAALQGGRISLANGTAIASDMSSATINGEGVEYPSAGHPSGTTMALIAANPYRPDAPISFELPEASMVRITVFNLEGQRIRELTSKPYAAGTHEISWDGRTGSGREAATGIYYVRGEFGQTAETRKLFLAR